MSRQTLFDIDMKLAAKNPNFKPGVMYDVMVARKDAHFFDFSKDVTKKIVEAVERFENTADIDRVPPPVRVGYYRFNFDELVFEDEKGIDYARLNSVLVVGSKIYFFQQPTNGDVLLYPFAVDHEVGDTTGLESSFYNSVQGVHHDASAHVDDSKDLLVKNLSTTLDVDDFEKDLASISNLTSFLYMAFATIQETKALTVEREQIESKWASGKNKAFYTKTTLVKIAMSKVRNKYLKRSEPTGRKNPWGEVRSHFAHWRVTNPDCEHQWHDRTGEGQKFKCDKCGEIKTLRKFPRGRGSKEVGIIKTNYEVSAT